MRNFVVSAFHIFSSAEESVKKVSLTGRPHGTPVLLSVTRTVREEKSGSLNTAFTDGLDKALSCWTFRTFRQNRIKGFILRSSFRCLRDRRARRSASILTLEVA